MVNNDVDKHFILITSHGRTATTWLSVALNLHPDFVCSHSNMTFPKPEILPDRLKLDRVAHLKGKAAGLSIDEYFDAQLTVAEAPYQASIHNYQIIGIDKRLVNAKRQYKIMNLIRHPITRFRSYSDYIVKMKSYSHSVSHWMSIFKTDRPQSLVEFVNQHYDIDFSDYANVAFIMSMSTLIAEIEELQTDYPSIQLNACSAIANILFGFSNKSPMEHAESLLSSWIGFTPWDAIINCATLTHCRLKILQNSQNGAGPYGEKLIMIII